MAKGGSTSAPLNQELRETGPMFNQRRAPTGGKGGMRPPASTGPSPSGKGGGTTMVERVPQGAMMDGAYASSLESILGGMNRPQPRPMGPAGVVSPTMLKPRDPVFPGGGTVYGNPVASPEVLSNPPQNGGIAELRQLFMNRYQG